MLGRPRRSGCLVSGNSRVFPFQRSQSITIEEYPDDKYGPTRLLMGFTGARRPLHIQIADSPALPVRIITLYEPDPAEWEDHERLR